MLDPTKACECISDREYETIFDHNLTDECAVDGLDLEDYEEYDRVNVYNFYGPVSGNIYGIYGYLDDGLRLEEGGLSVAEAGTPVLDIHPVGVGAAGSRPGAEAKSGDTPVL